MVQPWKKPFGKAKALDLKAEYEIEADIIRKWKTAELTSLLTRGFERMLEQLY